MIIPLSEKQVVRFWGKVKVLGPDDCWLWQAHCLPGGYGHFGVCSGEFKKMVLAHRVSYQIANGEIPDGLMVLHSCDIPSCVNPKHLHLGTHDENMAERSSRKRQWSILTEDQVVEIRSRRLSGEKGRYLAKEFNVSEQLVCDIKQGRVWSHLFKE